MWHSSSFLFCLLLSNLSIIPCPFSSLPAALRFPGGPGCLHPSLLSVLSHLSPSTAVLPDHYLCLVLSNLGWANPARSTLQSLHMCRSMSLTTFPWDAELLGWESSPYVKLLLTCVKLSLCSFLKGPHWCPISLPPYYAIRPSCDNLHFLWRGTCSRVRLRDVPRVTQFLSDREVV